MHPGDCLMLGRIGRMLLAAFITEVGGSLIQAGKGWVDRKLNPASLPPQTTAEQPRAPEPTAGPEAAPQGEIN